MGAAGPGPASLPAVANEPKRAPPGPELNAPRPSNPSLSAVRSAMRAAPEPEPNQGQPVTKERLREGAVDTVLNATTILGELLEDFRNSDRFFKYKAGVLLAWLALSVTSLGVACPPADQLSNDLAARIVANRSESTPVFMVKNDGAEPWENVIITVNGKFRATMTRIEASGGNVTLTGAVLFDEDGKRAPSNLLITDIELKVQEPEGTAVLLRGGEVVGGQ